MGRRAASRHAAAPVVVDRLGAGVLGRRRLRLGRLRVPRHRRGPMCRSPICSISSGYPLLALGLFQMARARAGRYARDGFLDGSIFAVAAAVALWQMLVVPTAAGTHSLSTAVVWSSYPLGDVLFLAARRLARARTRKARSCRRRLFVGSARRDVRDRRACIRIFRSCRRSTSLVSTSCTRSPI